MGNTWSREVQVGTEQSHQSGCCPCIKKSSHRPEEDSGNPGSYRQSSPWEYENKAYTTHPEGVQVPPHGSPTSVPVVFNGADARHTSSSSSSDSSSSSKEASVATTTDTATKKKRRWRRKKKETAPIPAADSSIGFTDPATRLEAQKPKAGKSTRSGSSSSSSSSSSGDGHAGGVSSRKRIGSHSGTESATEFERRQKSAASGGVVVSTEHVVVAVDRKKPAPVTQQTIQEFLKSSDEEVTYANIGGLAPVHKYATAGELRTVGQIKKPGKSSSSSSSSSSSDSEGEKVKKRDAEKQLEEMKQQGEDLQKELERQREETRKHQERAREEEKRIAIEREAERKKQEQLQKHKEEQQLKELKLAKEQLIDKGKERKDSSSSSSSSSDSDSDKKKKSQEESERLKEEARKVKERAAEEEKRLAIEREVERKRQEEKVKQLQKIKEHEERRNEEQRIKELKLAKEQQINKSKERKDSSSSSSSSSDSDSDKKKKGHIIVIPESQTQQELERLKEKARKVQEEKKLAMEREAERKRQEEKVKQLEKMREEERRRKEEQRIKELKLAKERQILVSQSKEVKKSSSSSSSSSSDSDVDKKDKNVQAPRTPHINVDKQLEEQKVLKLEVTEQQKMPEKTPVIPTKATASSSSSSSSSDDEGKVVRPKSTQPGQVNGAHKEEKKKGRISMGWVAELKQKGAKLKRKKKTASKSSSSSSDSDSDAESKRKEKIVKETQQSNKAIKELETKRTELKKIEPPKAKEEDKKNHQSKNIVKKWALELKMKGKKVSVSKDEPSSISSSSSSDSEADEERKAEKAQMKALEKKKTEAERLELEARLEEERMRAQEKKNEEERQKIASTWIQELQKRSQEVTRARRKSGELLSSSSSSSDSESKSQKNVQGKLLHVKKALKTRNGEKTSSSSSEDDIATKESKGIKVEISKEADKVTASGEKSVEKGQNVAMGWLDELKKKGKELKNIEINKEARKKSVNKSSSSSSSSSDDDSRETKRVKQEEERKEIERKLQEEKRKEDEKRKAEQGKNVAKLWLAEMKRKRQVTKKSVLADREKARKSSSSSSSSDSDAKDKDDKKMHKVVDIKLTSPTPLDVKEIEHKKELAKKEIKKSEGIAKREASSSSSSSDDEFDKEKKQNKQKVKSASTDRDIIIVAKPIVQAPLGKPIVGVTVETSIKGHDSSSSSSSDTDYVGKEIKKKTPPVVKLDRDVGEIPGIIKEPKPKNQKVEQQKEKSSSSSSSDDDLTNKKEPISKTTDSKAKKQKFGQLIKIKGVLKNKTKKAKAHSHSSSSSSSESDSEKRPKELTKIVPDVKVKDAETAKREQTLKRAELRRLELLKAAPQPKKELKKSPKSSSSSSSDSDTKRNKIVPVKEEAIEKATEIKIQQSIKPTIIDNKLQRDKEKDGKSSSSSSSDSEAEKKKQKGIIKARGEEARRKFKEEQAALKVREATRREEDEKRKQEELRTRQMDLKRQQDELLKEAERRRLTAEGKKRSKEGNKSSSSSSSSSDSESDKKKKTRELELLRQNEKQDALEKVEEARRREIEREKDEERRKKEAERQEEERRRKEAERQEEERRRKEAEKQEEERRRKEAERLEDERRRKEAERQEEERRRKEAEKLEDERRRKEAERQEEERRRKETERSELERKRQEKERELALKKLEDERKSKEAKTKGNKSSSSSSSSSSSDSDDGKKAKEKERLEHERLRRQEEDDKRKQQEQLKRAELLKQEEEDRKRKEQERELQMIKEARMIEDERIKEQEKLQLKATKDAKTREKNKKRSSKHSSSSSSSSSSDSEKESGHRGSYAVTAVGSNLSPAVLSQASLLSAKAPAVPSEASKKDAAKLFRKLGFCLTSLGLRKRSKFMGQRTLTIDNRTNSAPLRTPKPDVKPGQLWTDPSFTHDTALAGVNVKLDIVWKRPSEFCSKPALFTEGTTRFDIQQGAAGTCWFLSILSAIADQPEVMSQMITEADYAIGRPAYDGVFHCRLWRFGQWVDVYVDDLLPVWHNGSKYVPWGARSWDPNEVWVCLMEKAFAKFYGGYKSVFGGWAGDAFIALTGGVAERVETSKVTQDQLYQRVDNALQCGSVIACSVPANDDKSFHKGLSGNHAYTLTGAAKVPYKGRLVPLFRVRNPWGTQEGEWAGRWADAATEWQDLPAEVKDKLNVTFTDDGEFWMELEDFTSHFEDVHVCNFTPDFDQDGTPDGLDQVCVILGEWRGRTAAGYEEPFKFDNPIYEMTVAKEGMDASGHVPLVIQFTQKVDDPDVGCLYIKAEIFKLEYQNAEKGATVLGTISKEEPYYGGLAVTRRYRLAPGRYILLPHTTTRGEEKEFCIRTFSATPVLCRDVRNLNRVFISASIADTHRETCTVFGEWKGDTAAGCGTPERFRNPKYELRVPEQAVKDEDGFHPVMVQLLQKFGVLVNGDYIYIRADLYRMELVPWKGGVVILNQRTVNKKYFGGKPLVYSYQLEPGNYLVVPNTMNAGEETEFCMQLFSDAKIRLKKLQTLPPTFICNATFFFENDNKRFETGKTWEMTSEWKAGINAGGQVSNRTYDTNPQIMISLSGQKEVPLTILLQQEIQEPRLYIGVKLFPVDRAVQLPLSLQYLYRSYDKALTSIQGKDVLLGAHELEVNYVTPPGHYVALLYTNQAGEEKAFNVILATTDDTQIECKAYNMAE